MLDLSFFMSVDTTAVHNIYEVLDILIFILYMRIYTTNSYSSTTSSWYY